MQEELSNLSRLPLFKTPVLPNVRRDELSGIMTSVGHEIARSGSYRFDGTKRGTRPFAILQLTLSGEGGFSKGGQSLRLREGSLLFVQIPDEHIYFLPPDASSWEFVYLCFAGREFLRLAERIISLRGNLLEARDFPVFIRLVYRICKQVADSSSVDEFWSSGKLYELLMELLAGSYRIDEHKRRTGSAYVRYALEYCDSQLERDFSIEQIANELKITPEYLSRLFKASTGTTLKHHIESLRLERAIGLLVTGDLPVSRIARSCGYVDPNYFARTFRKRFGLSPREYRKENTGLYRI